MAITTSWLRTSPASTDPASSGAVNIQDDKKATDERARNGGHLWEPDGGADSIKTGRHACGVENTFGSSGAAGAHEFCIYAADGSTKLATFKAAAHANPGLELQDAANMTIKARKLQATTNGLLVDAGGATITAGGLTVTAGGLTVSAGDVALPAGVIGLAEIAANACSNIALIGSGTGTAIVNGVETTLVTGAITTGSTAGPVFVLAKGDYHGGGSGAMVTVRIYNDTTATLLDSCLGQTLANTDDRAFICAAINTGLSASTSYTYKLTVQLTLVGGGIQFNNYKLFTFEFRR